MTANEPDLFESNGVGLHDERLEKPTIRLRATDEMPIMNDQSARSSLGRDESSTFNCNCARIWNGAASASDLALMNIADIESLKLEYEFVEECVLLLREGWRDVRIEAEYLIRAQVASEANEMR